MNYPQKQPKRYRLYIDESGDHTRLKFDSPTTQYLGITGCLIEEKYDKHIFRPNMNKLKTKYFISDNNNPIILHREDIVKGIKCFECLKDNQTRESFNNDLIHFLQTQKYYIITVVIDKYSHLNKYGKNAYHPYHYCLTVLMERFCGYLDFINAVGDIMIEKRGGTEDRKLEDLYSNIYHNGTSYKSSDFFRKTLSTKHLKLQSKRSNIEGLQLSDLLAKPIKNEILKEKRNLIINDPFGEKICKIISEKHNRHIWKNQVYGFGKIFLE